MGLAKRLFSPKFWHRAVSVHGVGGVARAGLHTLRPQTTQQPASRALDLVEVTDDPIEAMYLGLGSARTPLILYPVSSLRVEGLGLRVDDMGTNPFTRTVAEYVSDYHTDVEGSALEDHLRGWKPKSIADLLGLDATAPGSVLAEPATPGLLPWSRPETAKELDERRDADERSWTFRFGPSEHGLHGSSMYGPASDEVIRYRFKKHVKVADSILANTHGVDRRDPRWWDPERGGFIEIQLLVDGDGSVGVVREGKHRSTALAALGVDRVMVSLPGHYPIVRRDEVRSWPAVKAGLFTVDEALAVFDRFMRGTPPWSDFSGHGAKQAFFDQPPTTHTSAPERSSHHRP